MTVVIGAAVLAYLVMLATVAMRWDGGGFEGLLVVAILGGVIMGVTRLIVKAENRGAVVADPFARGTADIVNVSHIRVAGLGGAGLVLAALVVALQYPLTTLAITTGILGGVLIAAALIVSRRRRTA
jgi:hypothetical protein